ncbi:MAG: hypothetical protein CVV27_11495 [Candidatus Melainabacteria bacterium HGW-Melainabacteria-1]|nr:MAG: hypothetical protein CVV27_11495 [Candidatus Melainabacteria bacterium HGW-Melainabacteria-1]
MNLNPLGPLGLPVRAGIELGRALGRRLSPQPEPQPRQQPRPATPQTPPRHPASPRTASFQDVAPMNAQAQELYRAILAYPDTQADQSQARQIAVETEAASRAFGVDPKVMLAIIAHESQGFDTRAVSHSGAKGLGQLTGVAIQEMRRLSYDPTYDASYPRGNSERQHYPDPEIQALVERPQTQAIFQRLGQREENRFNVRDNIWGSAFYARIAMDRAQENRSGAAVTLGENGMMGRYNGASRSERRAHSAGIADSYQRMFSQTIPSSLRPQV